MADLSKSSSNDNKESKVLLVTVKCDRMGMSLSKAMKKLKKSMQEKTV